MKYVVLVSHGKFAAGLKDSLEMLSGKREDLIALGLLDGTTVGDFSELVNTTFKKFTSDDELIILGDLIGGSPLTTTLNVAGELELLSKCVVIGGMNLPLALTCLLMKDTMDLSILPGAVLAEGKEALKEFTVASDDELEEI